MDPKMKAWRAKGLHLPAVFRDFHEQKEIISAMHELTQWNVDDGKPLNAARKIGLVEGHVYIVDCFLWFMARHGYTLQKTRVRNIEFEDLKTNAAAISKEKADAFAKLVLNKKENT